MTPRGAAHDDPLATIGHWYRTPLGRYVAHAEAVCLERLLADSFGHYLVQFGAPAQFAEAAATCRIRQRVVLGARVDATAADGIGLRALPWALPLATASVDAVVLPHTLDFCVEAPDILREVERVLIPEGRVIVFCFNPLSTWGLARWWPRLVRRGRRVPWCGAQLTPFRVGDWLRVLGFTLETREMLVFRPPLRRALAPRLDWLEPAGASWWPLLGGVYAVRAVKRVPAPTSLRPAWTRPPALLPGRRAEPTVRRDRGD
ncbi:class I SAM-dependent methyltransferase [Thiohalocapsa sp. ML1]|jgi:SAM-dependent methyltransferase|uniref:class I SAM-dependent methyltransferase n=1 Tax=Thiohalocapsa sp. ML1 TaxID=1431688 RepID=UPI00073211F1|nr:methyltransferase domain-containing protein [Thiohalocapsa sp. ML1]